MTKDQQGNIEERTKLSQKAVSLTPDILRVLAETREGAMEELDIVGNYQKNNEVIQEEDEKQATSLKTYILDEMYGIYDSLISGNEIISENGAKINIVLNPNEIEDLKRLKENTLFRLQIMTSSHTKLKLDKRGYEEEISRFDVEIGNLGFAAFEVPKTLHTNDLYLMNTHIGGKMWTWKNDDSFIGGADYIGDTPIKKKWLLVAKRSIIKGLPAYDENDDSEFKNASLRLLRLPTLRDQILLGEIIIGGLGQEFLNFDADKAKSLPQSRDIESIHAKDLLTNISKFLGIDYLEFDEIDGSHILNRGVYINNNNAVKAFLVGKKPNITGAPGGACAIELGHHANTKSNHFGTRYYL